MTNSTAAALRRYWVEYSPGSSSSVGRQILLPNFWSYFLTSLLSVWIGVWAHQYWKLIRLLFLLLLKFYKACATRVGATTGIQAAENLENLRERTAEETAIKILVHRFIRRHDTTIIATILNSWAFLFCAATFAGLAIAATIASLVALGSNGISESPLCGIWIPNTAASIVLPMGQIMLEVEDIYRECYENPSQPACNLFPTSNLFVNFTDDVDCPFVGDVCLEGRNSAIRLDTGYRDSVFLGINSPNRPLYRRTTTCAPLVTANYSNSTVDPITNFTNVKFFYSSTLNASDPLTYDITRYLAYEQILTPTGYDVKTVSSSLGQFTPIAELSSATGDSMEYTTLMFVNTFNINYPNISNDAIFPATNQTFCPQSTEPCWNNTILVSSVLGCTERAVVCYPDTDHCYDVWAPNALENMLAANWTGAEETYLTMLGLRYSDISDVLSTRHALLLNATQRIIGNRLSLALDTEQWQLESRRLFEMGLLRAKMEMLAVATGIRARYAGYSNVLPAARRGMCQMVKFQTQGFTNVSFVGLLLALFLPLAVGIGVEWALSDGNRKLYMLVNVLHGLKFFKETNAEWFFYAAVTSSIL